MLGQLIASGLALGSIYALLALSLLDFEMMFAVLLKAFAGAILGGFNSLPGAVAGCLLVGVLESLFAAYVSTAFKDTFAFCIIIAVLMLRPQGLFTRRLEAKV
jgi:branched-chain amino acid transport system permease protein